MLEAAPILASHNLKLALFQPQIAPNTGNIARLCVATDTALHLIRPLGFVLDDKKLRRSAMDYWPRLRLSLHADETAFFQATDRQRMWWFTTKSSRSIWKADFHDGDWLIFGSETHGLPQTILRERANQTLRIPQAPGERCLNLSTAAGIGLYEALRQIAQ